MTKAQLRKTALAHRKTLTAARRETLSQLITDQFFGHFSLDAVRYLHVFLSINQQNEVDTSFLIRRVWQQFPPVQLLIPKADPQSLEMDHYVYTAETILAANQWGIPEPVSGTPVPPERIDMVIVPLLAFDRRGYRVGYGKGFYDRFLARCRPDVIKVGVSYENPVPLISDIDPYDIALNYCVTPDHVWVM